MFDTELKVKIRHLIKEMEQQEVLRIEDEHGREYMWDGTEFYRLLPLKGKFGRHPNKI